MPSAHEKVTGTEAHIFMQVRNGSYGLGSRVSHYAVYHYRFMLNPKGFNWRNLLDL